MCAVDHYFLRSRQLISERDKQLPIIAERQVAGAMLYMPNDNEGFIMTECVLR